MTLDDDVTVVRSRERAAGRIVAKPGDYTVERVWSGGISTDLIQFPTEERMLYTEKPSDPDSKINHAYWQAKDNWQRGKRIQGVSGLVGVADLDSSRLIKAIARLAAQTGDPNPYREKTERGTRVHAYMEWLVLGDYAEPVELYPDDLPYVEAVSQWYRDQQPFDLLATEQFVYHSVIGYAGRYDLLIERNAKLVRIDLKTGSVWPKAFYQLMAYNIAAEQCGLLVADDLVVLQVGPDGYRELQSDLTREEFYDALQVRDTVKRIEKQTR